MAAGDCADGVESRADEVAEESIGGVFRYNAYIINQVRARYGTLD